MKTTIETEVLIIGAGPTGLSLACQLLRYGIDGGVSIELITGLLLRQSQWIHEVHQLN